MEYRFSVGCSQTTNLKNMPNAASELLLQVVPEYSHIPQMSRSRLIDFILKLTLRE